MPSARFTKAEIKRAVEAFEACGFEVGAVEIKPDGTIRVVRQTEENEVVEGSGLGPKEWPKY